MTEIKALIEFNEDVEEVEMVLVFATATCLLPGFNRERLIEELLVEIFLDVMDQNDSFALVIKLRTTSSSHHLQDIYVHMQYINFTPYFSNCSFLLRLSNYKKTNQNKKHTVA